MDENEVKLYVIATPLGNRNDITLRALEVFRSLSIFFAEDSREIKKLLSLHDIALSQKKFYSYARHNMQAATEAAMDYLGKGQSIGLVCDRGTPAVSDPGALLIQQARAENFSVVPIPGASSVITLISISGLLNSAFSFVGFLPKPKQERGKLLAQIKTAGFPVCFFESAKRIRKTLLELVEQFPEADVFLGREMTKLYEEYRWIPLKDLDPESVSEKGEYAVLLKFSQSRTESDSNSELLQEAIRWRLCSDKQWSKYMALRYDVSAKSAYDSLQRAKDSENANR